MNLQKRKIGKLFFCLCGILYISFINANNAFSVSLKAQIKENPNNSEAILRIARAYERKDNYFAAGKFFHKYLRLRPNEKKIWLDYITIEIWQDDFRKAMQLLEEYKRHFGITNDYLAYKARIYALVGWFRLALKINTPLLKKNPKNYYYLITQAIAYRNGNQPKESVVILKKINQVQPNSDETRFMNHYILTPIRSWVDAGGNYLFNSQDVAILHVFANANFYITPTTYLILRGLQENAFASLDSGLAPITGGTSTYDTNGSVGIYHRFSPYFAVRATGGALHIKDRNNFFIYDVTGYFNLGDRAIFTYEHSRKLYRPGLFIVFSPRSISLQILQEGNSFHLSAEPALDSHFNFYGYYTTLSDRNKFWELIFWPSTSIIRINGWKVDIGANMDLLSFNQRLNNGYYSPLLAEIYLGTLQLHYGIGLNKAISFSAGMGGVKDETFNNLHLAADLSAEFIYSISNNWQIILRGSYSYRGNPTNPYHSTSFFAVLTRRL